MRNCLFSKNNNKTAFFINRVSGILYLASFLLISFNQSIPAQTYYFEFFTDKDGLANPKVYSILQDDNHLVWTGTYAGLSTFDGKTITNYTSEQGLAPGGVKTIFRDSRGLIWFGHLDGGISRYDGKKFESRSDNLIVSKDITAICEDTTGHIWITTAGSGAAQIFNPDATLENLKYEKFSGDRISSMIFGCTKLHDNKLYFVTDGGIKTFNYADSHFENFIIEKLPTYFQITYLFEDRDLNLWFGTFHGGLYKYNPHIKEIKIYDRRDGLSSNWISKIYQDRSGIIWVGHYENGGITKIENDKLTIYNQTNGLGDCLINDITEDVEKNLLIGTKDNGFAIYKKGEEFVKFINNDKIFPSTDVRCILEIEPGKFWFGTNNGFVIYDYNKPLSTKYSIKPGGVGVPKLIKCAAKDKNNNIWIGTEQPIEIFKYNPKNQKIEASSLVYKYDFRSDMLLNALAVDHSNNLWIGTSDGLYRYNIDDQTHSDYRQEEGLAGFCIEAIFIDDNDNKYIGCTRNYGLTVFNKSLSIETSKTFKNLGNTKILCMSKDDKGNLWIGMENKGLISFKNGKIIKQYTTKDGLLSDIINSIIYKNGCIYIGTTAGLNRLNISSGTISVYTERNGFATGAKNNAICIDNDNNIWFGTSGGAICYKPPYQAQNAMGNSKENKQQTWQLTEPASTKITRFIVNLDTINIKPNIKLKHNQNQISIEFTSICLTNPDEVEYKFMLEGSDNNWQLTKETSTDYRALLPGKYVFKVMAKNYTGIWNTQPLEFSFIINPPFYKTWWFISICIFIGLVVLFVYIKIRERNLIKEKRVLEEKVAQRTAEIVKINRELAVKNKDITDSIQYASRIQNALLPPELPFENTFVLFKPKDIVSGDFFWFLAHDDMEWFAAVDCTGHGVPGAFMSIIGHNSLNKILQEYNITKPSAILNQLNEEVAATLHHYHQDKQIHDGMDIALASFDRNSRKLEFAGAFNPLWLVRNKELIETRANRYAIGIAPDFEKDFTNNEIKIEPGDTIYLFSDGYADQFGGKNNKKMKIGVFKDIILTIQDKSMKEQKIYLENFFEEWKNTNPQVDDVLIIGRRFEF